MKRNTPELEHIAQLIARKKVGDFVSFGLIISRVHDLDVQPESLSQTKTIRGEFLMFIESAWENKFPGATTHFISLFGEAVTVGPGDIHQEVMFL
jgi:hypothetical protein